MNIYEKVIAIADNTSAASGVVNNEKVTVSGNVICVDDVMNLEHPLEIQLRGINVNVSGVNVSRYGKNLIDFVGLLGGNGYTYTEGGLSSIVENGNIITTGTITASGYVYGMKPNRDTVTKQNIFLPAGTYTAPAGLQIQLHDADTAANTNYGKTFTIEKELQLVWFYTAYSGVGKVINKSIPLVLVAGTTSPTEYIQYIEPQVATSDSSGKVTGLTSVSPSMTIVPDSGAVTVECTYLPESAADIYTKYQQLKTEQTALQEKLKEYKEE